MEPVGLADLEYAVNSGGTPKHITAKEDVVLVTGPAVALRLYVDAVGTLWTITIYDNVAGTGKPILTWATADGKGSRDIKVKCTDGLRYVSAGTTAGVAVLHYIPLTIP